MSDGMGTFKETRGAGVAWSARRDERREGGCGRGSGTDSELLPCPAPGRGDVVDLAGVCTLGCRHPLEQRRLPDRAEVIHADAERVAVGDVAGQRLVGEETPA